MIRQTLTARALSAVELSHVEAVSFDPRHHGAIPGARELGFAQSGHGWGAAGRLARRRRP
jgi:hypothetical protein